MSSLESLFLSSLSRSLYIFLCLRGLSWSTVVCGQVFDDVNRCGDKIMARHRHAIVPSCRGIIQKHAFRFVYLHLVKYQRVRLLYSFER
jgi:hypothetical protein